MRDMLHGQAIGTGLSPALSQLHHYSHVMTCTNLY